MNEIRIQKIDGVEFVTYKDYLRLKEEKQELEYLGDINEDLKKDNEELKKDNQELKGLVDINRKLRKENKKLQEEIKNHKQNIMQDELEIIPKLEEENQELKEEIAELEKCNLNLQEQIDKLLNHNK